MRIATNFELLNLQRFLDAAPRGLISQGGLLMVLTFQSLEEKLVSRSFTSWKKTDKGNFGTKKPLEPGETELAENSKSRSAKLYSFVFK